MYVEAAVDGKQVVAETLPAGTQRTLPLAKDSVIMRASIGSAVDVTVNGSPPGPSNGHRSRGAHVETLDRDRDRARRFHIVSLGCAKNTVDSEAMEQLLLAAGPPPRGRRRRSADLLIVNTCGFIESAKQESIDTLLELGRRKTGRPEADRHRLPGRALSARAGRRAADGSTRSSARATGRRCRAWSPSSKKLRAPGSSLRLVELAPQGELDLEMPARRVNGPSAYLKISDGCDQRCAFCAIPFMKGNHRSKPAELILREVGELLEQGVREVVLVGQDTTRYGHDLGQRDGLAALLEQITDRYPELPWIRVMYAYPRHVTERFLGVLRERPQVLPYLDMPLQHTHPWTLARMRRPHRDIDDLVGWMRERVPGLVLRTTFIVGFPGETEAEFEYLLESVQRLRFDRVGVFTYSDEDGTAAFEHAGPGAGRRKAPPPRAADGRRARHHASRRTARLIGSGARGADRGPARRLARRGTPGEAYRDAPEVDGLVLVKAAAAAGRRDGAGAHRARSGLRPAGPARVTPA